MNADDRKSFVEELGVIKTLAESLKTNQYFHRSLDGQVDAIVTKVRQVSSAVVNFEADRIQLAKEIDSLKDERENIRTENQKIREEFLNRSSASPKDPYNPPQTPEQTPAPTPTDINKTNPNYYPNQIGPVNPVGPAGQVNPQAGPVKNINDLSNEGRSNPSASIYDPRYDPNSPSYNPNLPRDPRDIRNPENPGPGNVSRTGTGLENPDLSEQYKDIL